MQLDFGTLWEKLCGSDSPRVAGIMRNYIDQFADFAKNNPKCIYHVIADKGMDGFPSRFIPYIFEFAYRVVNVRLPKPFCELISQDDIFPWEEVEACLKDRIPVKSDHKACPFCGKPSEELDWISFCSSPLSWEMWAGTAGMLSICSDCHHQVEYIELLMN